VIGNGHQAEAQVLAHNELLTERNPQFSVFAPRDDPAANKGHAFARRLAEHGIPVRVHTSLTDAAGGADFIVTASAAREPLLSIELVSPGTHISAIGSDSPGKRELDPQLLHAARVIVDDPAQSRRFGESQSLDEPLALATIGDVLSGRAPGRQGDDEITVFDSTGIGLHDVVTAELAYERAVAGGVGTWITLA
jgi:ornithine cyclodeaminase/alanine dehydrogenase-like protein (mu-crystallin family)